MNIDSPVSFPSHSTRGSPAFLRTFSGWRWMGVPLICLFTSASVSVQELKILLAIHWTTDFSSSLTVQYRLRHRVHLHSVYGSCSNHIWRRGGQVSCKKCGGYSTDPEAAIRKVEQSAKIRSALSAAIEMSLFLACLQSVSFLVSGKRLESLPSLFGDRLQDKE